MPTLKQITKSPYWWGKLKSGAQITVGRRDQAVDITVEQGDSVRRMFETYVRWNKNEYQKPDENLTTMHFLWPLDGKFQNARCKPDQIDFIVLPPVPKSFRSAATKGSRWRFHSDWTFSGYDGTLIEHTIPAGTEFVISKNKHEMARWGSWYTNTRSGICFDEKGLNVNLIPELQDVFPKNHHGESVLPMKEVAGYVELVEAGDVKTYWLMQNNDGNRIVDKRFKGLSNLKASLRVHGGLVNYQDGSNGDYVPEWLESDNQWSHQRFCNGVWAVQYDHATDAELKREDMLEYMFITKLKG